VRECQITKKEEEEEEEEEGGCGAWVPMRENKKKTLAESGMKARNSAAAQNNL
jgi:hypothetical protein